MQKLMGKAGQQKVTVPPIFGMWADREDIPDGVTYEDRMRQSRY
jgi:hypothetical protein